jgi:hypothetical protein
MKGSPVTLAFLALVIGCTVTPARFRQRHISTYMPKQPIRIRVVGFTFERFRPTGIASAQSFGGIAGSGVAGTWGSGAQAVEGEYVTGSYASDVAAVMANTGCFRVVGPEAQADYVFDGRVDGEKALGFGRRALSIVEALTLTPILGAPLWGRAEGTASINVYDAEGTLVRSFYSTVPVDFVTTLYSHNEDEPNAIHAAMGWAVIDVVEKAASTFCGPK